MSQPVQGNPWLTIWTRPRQTLRKILNTNPSKQLAWLYVIYALPITLYFAQVGSFGVQFPAPLVFLLAFILAFVLGFIGIHIGSAFLFWTGKWLGGVGTFKEVRAAVAWSNVPNLVNCLTWIISGCIFGKALFLASFPYLPITDGQRLYMTGVFIAQLVVAVWSLILFFHTVAEAQGFTLWRAFLSAVLALVIVLGLVWGIGKGLNMMILSANN